jgi:hypothetical protein
MKLRGIIAALASRYASLALPRVLLVFLAVIIMSLEKCSAWKLYFWHLAGDNVHLHYSTANPGAKVGGAAIGCDGVQLS